jgi:hypothetical protein
MMMVLYMLDDIVVKIVSLKKSAQRIVCYSITYTWALAEP